MIIDKHRCEEPACKFMSASSNEETWLCQYTSNPKAPGVVKYLKKPKPQLTTTWIQWFEKYSVFLDGNALTEAHNLYLKDKGKQSAN